MNGTEQFLNNKLKERELANNLRILRSEKFKVDFFSNDYLGLVTTGTLQDLVKNEPEYLCNTGSTGSRLLSGNNADVEELEQLIAKFHKAEAALLFNSGYNANTGLIASIVSKDTVIIYDELCHASIIDGIRLSISQKRHKFKHNDIDDLEEKLKKITESVPVIVITESVFSMDGDLAPLAEIANLCTKYNAQLIVDEAHATGVFGAKGEGLVCALGLQDVVFARVHTYGKALGCHGASVVGSDLLKQFLVNFSRTFIYTTALPGHSITSIKCAYKYLATPSFTNEPLHQLISYFRHKTDESKLTGWIESLSPIQILITGDNGLSKKIESVLQNEGLHVKAILHPTVPLGKERLRICLHTFNTKEQIDLLHSLVQV